jgi:nucleotide-binding universal stress UspA family protein
MYRYKRLLVALSMSERDGTTIRYAGMISRMAESERVYFAYVPKSLDLPDDLCCEYPELEEPLDEAEAHVMEAVVQEHFDGPAGISISYEVPEGSQIVELLRLAKHKNIDLVIAGVDPKDKGHRTLTEKLARKAPCSVLMIPEGAKPEIRKVLVPVDFSDHTQDTMDVAVAFATAAKLDRVHCLHAYHVPPGFQKTGKTYEQFAKIMLGHAEKKLHESMKNIDLKGLEMDPLYVLDDKPHRAVLKAIETEKPDLLITGTRGRSAAAAILLGSVTEHLLQLVDIPMVAVKRKGAGMGFLDALLKI